jgi:hypothetical protein
MGKRELLIIAAFVLIGGLAYQLTAPAAPEHEGFSIGKLIDEIRAEIREDSTSATVTHEGTIAVGPGVTELRLTGVSTRIVMTGEARDDVAYALTVRSTGPDETAATEYATRSQLVEDDLGDVLALRVRYPPEARQTSEITLRVPARLAVRLEGGNTSTFSHLQAVRIEGVIGETTVEDIAGEVSGSQRNGRLRVTRAGSVNLNLVSSRAEFAEIRDGITLTARSGESRIAGSRGAITIEETNHDIEIVGHDGPIRIGGTNGQLEIVEPRGEVRVDVRRVEIEIVLDRAVPVTVISTEDTLRLTLVGPPALLLDAVATAGGEIVADDFGLESVARDDQVELHHAFDNATAPRVSLRNRRAAIVIRSRK